MSNPEPNPYETALERYQKIRALYVAFRKISQDMHNVLEDEWTAAEHDLAQYEEKPGVPLPQYRQSLPRTEPGPCTGPGCKHVSHET
jgi:hypothetical protein